MKKLFMLVFSMLIISVVSVQSYDDVISSYETYIDSQNWFYAIKTYKLIIDMPEYKKNDFFDSYSIASDKYHNFINTELLLKDVLKDDIINTDICIRKISLIGSSGCLFREHKKYIIRIGKEVVYTSNKSKSKISIDDFYNYNKIFKLIIERCQERSYGRYFSTGDFTGILKIEYEQDGKKYMKEYDITYGYIENIYIYLALYPVMGNFFQEK